MINRTFRIIRSILSSCRNSGFLSAASAAHKRRYPPRQGPIYGRNSPQRTQPARVREEALNPNSHTKALAS